MKEFIKDVIPRLITAITKEKELNQFARLSYMSIVNSAVDNNEVAFCGKITNGFYKEW